MKRKAVGPPDPEKDLRLCYRVSNPVTLDCESGEFTTSQSRLLARSESTVNEGLKVFANIMRRCNTLEKETSC